MEISWAHCPRGAETPPRCGCEDIPCAHVTRSPLDVPSSGRQGFFTLADCVQNNKEELEMTMSLAFDVGYGNIKLYGSRGGLVMQSAVSVGSGQIIRRMMGLRSTRPPLRIETRAGVFHVGENAHDWGRPVENLDFERLTGSPEMLALFFGAITHYGVPDDPVALIVGLPIVPLMGEEAKATQQAVRRALRTTHTWQADGVDYTVTVRTIRITSQPVGAMFDYLLNEKGEMPAQRRIAFKGEIGILGLGMNTVELLVVRNGSPVQRFTAGRKLGVRRLLELINYDRTYSLAELDAQLRHGSLDITRALPVWQSEVLGLIEMEWGTSFRRFGVVVVVGGGASFLREALVRRFRDRTFIPENPIIATARGLHKYTLMQARRRRE